MANLVKSVVESVEGGRAYIPPPPSITIFKDDHKGLGEKVVGDTINLEITAHVMEYDEEGRYRIQLDNIQIVKENPRDKLIKKAESEVINIGTISPETLNSIFSTKPKENG